MQEMSKKPSLDSEQIAALSKLRTALKKPLTWKKLDRLTQDLQLLQSVQSLEEKDKITIEKILKLFQTANHCAFQNFPSIQYHRVQEGSKERPYQKKGRYYNYKGEKIWQQLVKRLLLLFVGICHKPTFQDLTNWHRIAWQPCARAQIPQFTWLGHSSLLLQAAQLNILIDPTFHFVSPCFRRHTQAGISFEELPAIDLLAISHNHADHFEKRTLRSLASFQPLVFVPKGLGKWFNQQGYLHVEESTWGSQLLCQRETDQIKISAVPARHGSQTAIRDLNRSLWMGIVIEAEGKKFYIAGDTAYDTRYFEEIKQNFGEIDIPFLPISPEGEPALHLNHEDALEAFEFLGAKTLVPIHWGAYRMGKERIEEPLEKFLHTLHNSPRWSKLKEKILLPKIGEVIKP